MIYSLNKGGFKRSTKAVSKSHDWKLRLPNRLITKYHSVTYIKIDFAYWSLLLYFFAFSSCNLFNRLILTTATLFSRQNSLYSLMWLRFYPVPHLSKEVIIQFNSLKNHCIFTVETLLLKRADLSLWVTFWRGCWGATKPGADCFIKSLWEVHWSAGHFIVF